MSNDTPRTLYAISQDLLDFADLLYGLGGELPSEEEQEAVLLAWFAQLTQDRDTKIDHYVSLIYEMEAHAQARKHEAERLLKLASYDTNLAQRLRKRLFEFFKLHELERLRTDRYQLAVVRNGGVLPLVLEVQPRELPPRFQHVTVDYNKDALRAALDAGESVQGASYGPRGERLSIR